MINSKRFTQASQQAYLDVTQFFDECLPGPMPVFDRRFFGKDLIWAYIFAFKITGVGPVGMGRLPRPGFSSWLMTSPDTAIALFESQLTMWQQKPPTRFAVRQELQKARTVLHEVGHIRLQPHLLRGSSGVFAIPAEPGDEEQAWVYAGTVLALLLGDYAYLARTSPGGSDTTPAVSM